MNVTDVAAMLGIGDEWLEAWWLEQSFGEHPMKAGLKGEPLRIITTLSELLALVRDWDDLVSEVAHG